MGTSLSYEDVAIHAGYGLRESIAIDVKYRHRLVTPPGAKEVSWQNARERYISIRNDLDDKYAEMFEKLSVTRGYEIANNLTKEEHTHETMKILAKEFGWIYTREGI